MASLQQKGDSWYCQFMYQRQRHTYTIGKVDEAEAKTTAARIDYLLMRIRQRLMSVPNGVDILTFIIHDGNPPGPDKSKSSITDSVCSSSQAVDSKISTTFRQLREAYMRTMSNGSLEDNTLYTMNIQLEHLEKMLGRDFLMATLDEAKLQEYVDGRQGNVCALTIKKEIHALRAAWNWGSRRNLVHGPYPSYGLIYPKSEEQPPFMTFEEIQWRIECGGNPKKLWECLYLTSTEVEGLLDLVEKQSVPLWVHPAFVLVGHTGARRSEMMRAKWEDIDFRGKMVTIDERKRKKGHRTSRRVPMSTRLFEVLQRWSKTVSPKGLLFSNQGEKLSPKEVEGGFDAAVRGSPWDVIRGWHTLRHSFISALASRGVDQRIIDEFVGHQTDEQRRRYRHLYPSIQKEAMRSVFG